MSNRQHTERSAAGMMDYEEALELIFSRLLPLGMTALPLDGSLHATIAGDIRAPGALPRFDSSAVDGFGIHARDREKAGGKEGLPLRIRGAVRAGDRREPLLRPGTAIRINTGAPVPSTVAAVVKKEDVEERGADILLRRVLKPGENIRRRGGEFRRGEIVLRRGELVTPPVAALLASLGYESVPVIRNPRIALVVTGNELRSPGSPLRHGEIHESATIGLRSALEAIGIREVNARRVRDNAGAIRNAVEHGLRLADVLITVGGISVGDRDLVKDVFTEIGVRRIFWRVAIKPGKPFFFGMKKGKCVFGLPGNPVSAMISFFLFVRPALLYMSGSGDTEQVTIRAVLAGDLRKHAKRLEFVRARLERRRDGSTVAIPMGGQDSHMLGGLAGAQGLILFPKNRVTLCDGSTVSVMLLNWNIL